jgi:CBS domain containing-hemolysin-like protein
MSVTEALLLLVRNRSALPVIDETTQRVVGVLSYWDALAAIAKNRP